MRTDSANKRLDAGEHKCRFEVVALTGDARRAIERCRRCGAERVSRG